MNRLILLHLRSRRVPLIIALMAVTAGILRAVEPLTTSGSEFAVLLPLALMVACAALIAAGTRSPFGEPERATFALPRLRLIHLLILVAIGVLVIGIARIGDDPVAAMRNVAGLTGIALLGTPVVGAALAWIAPLAYVFYCGGPVDVHQVTLWAWPALPGSATGATPIALALLIAGIATVTVTGARDQRTDPL
jgi:hypothetical protein